MSDYGWLINVEEFGDKRDYFVPDRWAVSFYCKECKKIVATDRPNPNGYTFVCQVCESENIAIGTEESLKTKYKIK